jgi:ketosteroid isomerase-like protein
VIRPATDEEWDAVDVARRFSDAVSARDLDSMMTWYHPDAVVHWEGSVLVELVDIRRVWEGATIMGHPPTRISPDQPESSTFHDGFDVVMVWAQQGREGVDVESRLRVRHGAIVEQWHGDVVRFVPVVGPSMDVAMAGDITVAEREQVVDALWRVLEPVEASVHHVGVRLERHRNPARAQSLTARVHVDRDRHRVVARVSAPTMGEVAAQLEQRLRHQLGEHASRLRALRRRGPASPEGEWRHGDGLTRRSGPPALGDDERLVMVRSTWAGGVEHVDEAIEDLEALDLEVLLFRELHSRGAAVVWRAPEGYGLRCAQGGDPTDGYEPPPVAHLDIDPHPFSTMDLDSARTELSMGAPWVVFHHRGTGEPGLLYRRLDGHDGLVVLGDT